MFSVPGWNLSAPIATQVETPKPRDATKEGKKAKKRQQKQEEQQVDASNIGEYWEKVVKGQNEGKEGENTVAPADDVQAGDGAKETRGKKRKRKGNKGNKNEEANGDQNVQADADKDESRDTGTEAADPAKTASGDAESKRDKKKRKKEQKSDAASKPRDPLESVPLESLIPEPKGLTPLQKSMRSKLASARFRHLNESLYTKPSRESLELFKEDPSMFEDYHRGFAQQVEVWPENPVDGYVEAIITRGKTRSKDPWKDKKRKEKKSKGPIADSSDVSDAKPLPRNMKGVVSIADLGCGTASLAYRLQPQFKALNLNIQSFDLSKPSGPSAPLVTVADISALPIPHGSVDVAIFCLALMGVNWLDFIDEAWRILRWRGELWVSEIKSRFGRVSKAGKPPINSIGSLRKKETPKAKKKAAEKPEKPEEEGIQGSEDEAELAEHVDGAQGKEGTDVSAFVEVLRKRGFVLDAPSEAPNKAIDLSNKMFVKMHFVKSTQPTRGGNAGKEADRGGKPLHMGIKGKKFTTIMDEDTGNDESDAKVLKPCLYKIR